MMTLEKWPAVAWESMKDVTWVPIILMFYILFTNVTLMRTVASVIAEHILPTAKTEELENKAKVEKEFPVQAERLVALFKEIDENGDGRLDEEELLQVVSSGKTNPDLHQSLILADLNPLIAQRIFKILHWDRSGWISVEELVEGAQRVKQLPK